jgi:hypothetical protein
MFCGLGEHAVTEQDLSAGRSRVHSTKHKPHNLYIG